MRDEHPPVALPVLRPRVHLDDGSHPITVCERYVMDWDLLLVVSFVVLARDDQTSQRQVRAGVGHDETAREDTSRHQPAGMILDMKSNKELR